MRKIVTFPRGGSVEIYPMGCAVISATGEVRRFASDGTPVCDPHAFTKATNPLGKYFFSMGENERKMIKKWLATQVPNSEEQVKFLERVKTALWEVNYNYSIAMLEPTKDEGGKISYEEGMPVYTHLTLPEWEEKAKEYWPEKDSKLANLFELDLWYAYRVVTGHWTLEYICDNSSDWGNYWNSPSATHEKEEAGIIKVGGFADGVSNTRKIVKAPDGGFCICGGCYKQLGTLNPVAKVEYQPAPSGLDFFSSGVVVLKGNIV